MQPLLRRSLTALSVTAAVSLALVGCSEDPAEAGGGGGGGGDASGPAYLLKNVVFGPEGETAYAHVLESLDEQQIDVADAVEFPGWADAWVHDGAVFLASGEAPELTRYRVDEARRLIAQPGVLSFQDYGTDSAAFWGHVFVSDTKAYWFNTAQREVVVWNPNTLEVTGSFPMPELLDREAKALVGPTADRSSVVRGSRAYVPFYWADWTNADLSDDSVVLTIDTERDEVVATTSVDCPEINFVTTDDEGTIYLSNWSYSVVPALVAGHAPSCAVRILPGEERIDADWRLRFSELTEGREAANLRFLGDGKALLTVFHDERVELGPDVDRYALTDSANWRLWLVDLASETAEPLDGLGWHAPGLYSTRIDGEFFLALPSADYSSTKVYSIGREGAAQERFETTGWLTRIFRVR